METKRIDYTRGDPSKRAKRAEYLLKRCWKRARKLRDAMDGKTLAVKIDLQRKIKDVERHAPRLRMLAVCYGWLAEDAAKAS